MLGNLSLYLTFISLLSTLYFILAYVVLIKGHHPLNHPIRSTEYYLPARGTPAPREKRTRNVSRIPHFPAEDADMADKEDMARGREPNSCGLGVNP
jgi:hypothetical protein